MNELGKWDYRGWAEGKPKEKMEEFWKHFDQMVKRVERDARKNDDGGVVAILDWDCYSLSKEASPAGTQSFCDFKVHN